MKDTNESRPRPINLDSTSSGGAQKFPPNNVRSPLSFNASQNSNNNNNSNALLVNRIID